MAVSGICLSGLEKGVITKGVFSLQESLESLKSLDSLESLENGPDSPLFSTVWGFSKLSRISKFSRISRKWTFLKRPLFQKTPFSEPELGGSRGKLPGKAQEFCGNIQLSLSRIAQCFRVQNFGCVINLLRSSRKIDRLLTDFLGQCQLGTEIHPE